MANRHDDWKNWSSDEGSDAPFRRGHPSYEPERISPWLIDLCFVLIVLALGVAAAVIIAVDF